jgi:hypothetical protein
MVPPLAFSNISLVSSLVYLPSALTSSHLTICPPSVSITLASLQDLSPRDREGYTTLSKYNLRKLHMWAAKGLAETCYLTYADQPSGLGPEEVLFVSGGVRWMKVMEEWRRARRAWSHSWAWEERARGHPSVQLGDPVQETRPDGLLDEGWCVPAQTGGGQRFFENSIEERLTPSIDCGIALSSVEDDGGTSVERICLADL